jgi:hypothetical protein
MNLFELIAETKGFGTNLSRLPSHLLDLKGVSSGTAVLGFIASSERGFASFSSVSISSPFPDVMFKGPPDISIALLLPDAESDILPLCEL